MAVEIGEILEGSISRIAAFGAFVNLPDNQSGMVHISEISQQFVQDINEFIKIGDIVKVKVLAIDDVGRISLSIRKAEAPRPSAPPTPRVAPRSDNTFEDKVTKFMKDSADRLLDIRRNQRARRGGKQRKG